MIYYNEIDPFAAGWLRNLMIDGLIPFGDVDTRSIEDVSPDDLRPYTQCHFFAGIGVWSYALRLAGWPDDRPVWTGSCPCQPFSAAGKGGGFADERHLWPAMFHLIRERRPVVWLGEQVASKDGLGWFDLVQADLEGEGYAVGAVDTCSAGFGAPHIRQRLRLAAFRVADTYGRYASAERQQRGGEQRQQPQDGGSGLVEHASGDGRIKRRPEPSGRGLASRCGVGGMADPTEFGRLGRWAGEAGAEPGTVERSDGLRAAGGLEHPELPAQPRQRLVSGAAVREQDAAGLAGASVVDGLDGNARDAGLLRQQAAHPGAERPGPVNGFWRAADWLYCRDGKWRPVEPGTFPLAHGAPARVGRLRGYGNAVDAIATKEFIKAVMGRAQ